MTRAPFTPVEMVVVWWANHLTHMAILLLLKARTMIDTFENCRHFGLCATVRFYCWLGSRNPKESMGGVWRPPDLTLPAVPNGRESNEVRNSNTLSLSYVTPFFQGAPK